MKTRLMVSMGVRGLGAGLGYLLNIYIGNIFGGSSLGFYYLFITWKNVLGNFAGLGYPTKFMKSAPIAFKNGRDSNYIRYLSKVLLVVIAGFSIISLIFFIFNESISTHLFEGKVAGSGLFLIVIAGLLYTLIRLLSGLLKGIKKPGSGLFLEFTFIPLFVLAALLTYHQDISENGLVKIYLIAMVMGLVFFLGLTINAVSKMKHIAGPKNQYSLIEKDQLNIYYTVVLNIISNSGIMIILPLFLDTAEIGVFGSAHRTVMLSTIPLNAIVSVFSPKFSLAYSTGAISFLKKLYLKAQAWSFFSFLPLFLILIFFREEIMLLFADDFGVYAYVMIYMAVGQLINVTAGPAGFLLNMTGKDRLNVRLSIITTLVGFAVNVFLGYLYGIAGFAIGYMIDKGFRNLVRLYFTFKSFRIES